MTHLVSDIVEHGMGVVAVAAGIWMLWYLVKFTVVKLSEQVGMLTDKIKDLSVFLKEFTGHVRREHGEHFEAQKECKEHLTDFRDNQREMVSQLKEITDALGRINGYKK